MKWQDRRLLDLFGIDHPILQAPMAGITSPQMDDRGLRGGRAGFGRRRDADGGGASQDFRW